MTQQTYVEQRSGPYPGHGVAARDLGQRHAASIWYHRLVFACFTWAPNLARSCTVLRCWTAACRSICCNRAWQDLSRHASASPSRRHGQRAPRSSSTARPVLAAWVRNGEGHALFCCGPSVKGPSRGVLGLATTCFCRCSSCATSLRCGRSGSARRHPPTHSSSPPPLHFLPHLPSSVPPPPAAPSL